MNLSEYQLLARRTVPKDMSTIDLLTNFSMGLAGEAGEVIDELKKHIYHGHTLDRAHVEEELGDVLFYLTNIATLLGLRLDNIAAANLAKLHKRYPDGFNEEQSINRTL